MPRLTSQQYLEAHQKLAIAHHDEPLMFGSLSPAEQWALHAYFVPSKGLSDQQLLDHRKTITKEQPSLPQRAGRALAHIERNYDVAAEAAHGDHTMYRKVLSDLAPGEAFVTKRGRQIRVVGIAKPEPDARLFAQAIVDMVRSMTLEERAKLRKGTRDEK